MSPILPTQPLGHRELGTGAHGHTAGHSGAVMGTPGVRLRRFQNLGLVHSTVYRMPCFINKTVMELQKPGSECSQEKHVNILAP